MECRELLPPLPCPFLPALACRTRAADDCRMTGCTTPGVCETLPGMCDPGTHRCSYPAASVESDCCFGAGKCGWCGENKECNVGESWLFVLLRSAPDLPACLQQDSSTVVQTAQ